MNLREWNSNSKELMNFLKEEDKQPKTEQKVLGLNWNTVEDSLQIPFGVIFDQQSNSKRKVLKTIAALFDPLGIFSPLLLRAKLFLQLLWTEKLDWDDPLGFENERMWMEIQSDLKVNEVNKIPRFTPLGSDTELVCFADASKSSYCAVVYLRSRGENDWSLNLIFSKIRLAPKRTLAIPRLELIAVTIGVRLLIYLEKQLAIPIIKKRLFTDSECVLHWLKSMKPLAVFVENRVREIRKSTDIEYRYVRSSENVADIGTRITTFKEFSQSTWLSGPGWLKLDEGKWPDADHKLEHPCKLAESEVEKPSILYSASLLTSEKCHSKGTLEGSVFELKASDFSTLTKLLRVTAWCYRFLQKMQKRPLFKGSLKTLEIRKARE